MYMLYVDETQKAGLTQGNASVNAEKVIGPNDFGC